MLALSPVVVVVTAPSWQLLPLFLLPLFLVHKTASISREKEHAALHDALTGLANRKLLVAQMAAGRRGARAHRASRSALFLLDLDRFKEVNDTLGHHAGDRLLQIAADRLARAVRPRTRSPGSAATSSPCCCTDVRDAGGRARDRRSASGRRSTSPSTWTA